jgi:branched-subunit amino acid transport protein
MTAWMVILAVAAGTYGLRAVMLVELDGRRMSPGVAHALSFIGPAMAGALVATMAFVNDGRLDPAPRPELAAMLVGFLAVHRTGNVMFALATGMPTLWLLRAVGG